MQCHKSQWKTQSTQDTWNKKEKLVKTNWVLFFTVEKRQKSDENPVEEVQSPKTIPNLQLSINSKHWKSEEDFDYEKAAAIKGVQKKTEE